MLSPLIAPRSESSGGAPLLELKGTCASYGQARVLKGIDLTVREGEAVAVFGANGAGKTTLARTISGAIAPTSGVLWIAGKDVAAGRHIASQSWESRIAWKVGASSPRYRFAKIC